MYESWNSVVARPSGVLNRHRGFQNIGLPNPVFTVENSADNNPIHTTHSNLYTQHACCQTHYPAEHSLTVRPAKLHKVKAAQFWRTSGPVLNVDWLQTSSGTEKLSNWSPIQTAALRQQLQLQRLIRLKLESDNIRQKLNSLNASHNSKI